jgi:hypothetical protein
VADDVSDGDLGSCGATSDLAGERRLPDARLPRMRAPIPDESSTSTRDSSRARPTNGQRPLTRRNISRVGRR